MFEFEEIIDKISEHAKISKEEILKQVEDKQIELSGLVSREGAAYIVGRELGVNLLKEGKRKLKINNIVSGMRFVDVTARVTRISDIREFEREGKKGKVVNLLLADETGAVRLSLWNEETDLIASGQIKEDDVVKITGGYVKTDDRGNIELRVGRGKIEEVDEEMPEVSESSFKATTTPAKQIIKTPERKTIDSLKEGNYEEIRGCIMQLFNRNPFYEVCPKCTKKVNKIGDKPSCNEHGEVEPAYRLVVSGILDDGFGNIRVVFFGDVAERVAGKKTEALRKIAEKQANALAIYDNIDCVGKEFVIKGRVKKDEMTGNLEIIADDIENVNPKKEIELLLKEYKV